MAITISPLDLVLDDKNPRFVILTRRDQAAIRTYLVTYEEILKLTTDINEYGGLLPGERIVVLEENNKYVVVEGNRRTCALQFLLSRELIPGIFKHKIPYASESVIKNCSKIEVDVLENSNAALELMAKRHIQGIKQWKPLAKKQFFAVNYRDGKGQTIRELSEITGIKEHEIRNDIRDYKFFLDVYQKYVSTHKDFKRELIELKTEPFWRIFKAKFKDAKGNKVSPKDFLKISFDKTHNTVSGLPSSLFEQITQLVFEQTIAEGATNTRNDLTGVNGIDSLLQAVETSADVGGNEAVSAEHSVNTGGASLTKVEQEGANPVHPHEPENKNGSSPAPGGVSGGQRPGGPSPDPFFQTISWDGKLDPSELSHRGLLSTIKELHDLSCKKAYRSYPIATGMLLRTVYEQALQLRLSQAGLWEELDKRPRGWLPTLSSMEDFISTGKNKSRVFEERKLQRAYDRVVKSEHREVLNANIHNPGDIAVTAASLEAIARGGMFSLIQGIINLL